MQTAQRAYCRFMLRPASHSALYQQYKVVGATLCDVQAELTIRFPLFYLTNFEMNVLQCEHAGC